MGHQSKPTYLRALIAALLAVPLALVASPVWAQVGSVRYSAIVVDAYTGKIIMGQNQDELRFPASLTKLMTLYMAFEALRDRRIQLTQYVPVSAWAAEQPPTKLGLQPGEALTVQQAILGLVTKSANDAAAALGEFLGGSEDRFAQMMTLRARALGMNRTSFRNASGLPDPNQWTTARDLATLGRRLVLDFPQLYGYFSVPGFVWHNRLIVNHDTMLRTYPGADGMKTGFTDYAGHNLVTSAVRGGVRLIGVVMGTASNSERDQNMAMLLDDGFVKANTPGNRFAGSLIAIANAATTFSMHPAQPVPEPAPPMPAPLLRARPASLPPSAVSEPSESAASARPAHDRAVQFGAFPAERSAWTVAEQSARLAPDAQARVRPSVYGRRTIYHAQLVGVSEAEGRMVCANLSRRGPACQVFRISAAPFMVR
jgi:D-alanyl-D-alanine carboxypeptidase